MELDAELPMGGPLNFLPTHFVESIDLAMTARDLAIWDIATIDQTILRPASYHTMQTNVLLKNGMATGYGLGVQVGAAGGRRQVFHTGEVSGFTAANTIYPDDRESKHYDPDVFTPGDR